MKRKCPHCGSEATVPHIIPYHEVQTNYAIFTTFRGYLCLSCSELFG